MKDNIYEGESKAEKLFSQLIGQTTKNVQLGHSSFITLEWGDSISIEVKTTKGIRTRKRGAWHLWVYVCAWRLNKNGEPLCGSSDKEVSLLKKSLMELNYKKIISVSILNHSFDLQIIFEGNLCLHVFSYTTKDYEHWILYTPTRDVFVAGPGNKWSYEKSELDG